MEVNQIISKSPYVQQTFKRIETKYFLDEDQYRAFRKVLDGRMVMDQFGIDTINTVYYDTGDYAMIRRSLTKPVYKEKLRIRGYGIVEPGKTVYAEIKKKYKGIVYKRREPVTTQEVMRWMEKDGAAPRDTQITREIDYMRKIYDPEAKVFIACEREALFHPNHPDLRVTFDQNIRWRDTDLVLTKGSVGELLLHDESRKYLMEVKIPGGMPLWMVHALEEIGIRRTSFSKYGTYYKNIILKKNEVTHLC